MRLLRVEVPKFRALENVVIDFEPDFTPQVFPLGSLNGGGKSTLLQLIFVLLHHSLNKTALKNISELINDYNLTEFSKLASITILSKNHGKVCLEYFYGKENDILNNLNITESFLFNGLTYYYVEEEKHLILAFYIPYFFILVKFLDYQNILGNLKEELKKEKNRSTSKKIEKLLNPLNEIFYEIHIKTFLISPSNQPYLFLSREERRALFSKENKPKYDQAVKNVEETLPNFFTFDFVDILVEVFRRARAKDFKERNKENPFFHTEKLEDDINSLFIDGKKINSLIIEQQRHTQDEIQGVFFTLPSGQEVYPEDLSHGELKRLAIFVLIKYHEMQDAIVLIDEIENGFHPDWQRHIVDDLVEWGASNQYILATHSYELCRGVTAAHVKDLDPKLSY
ncbi:MAG: AAA family ATPase [Methylococcales bacterium]|nr:AAA family ATPase [Methylococcales bacterium]MDP3837684.1 AAA family ATPase [Methylococcales bacterium]